MRVLRASAWAAACALGLVASPAFAADQLRDPDATAIFDLKDFATGLTAPTSFAWLPDGRMVVTEKLGAAKIIGKTGKATTAGQFDVDSESEKGLLHVLVHPAFAQNHLLIFYYSASGTNADPGSDADRHRVVTVELKTDKLDMATQKILLRGLHGPANHDGGSLAIGPDGKLYVGVGDTGNNSNQATEPVYTPTNFNGTCLTNANGKILRINLDGTIPSDNPLVGKKVSACGDNVTVDPTTLPLADPRTEIWAWGFRNPWRFWFDPVTTNLWVGDVGEVTYEELDIIPPSGKGKHYGWPYREGGKGHDPSTCATITPNAGNCVDPQYYCKHGGGVNGIDGNCAAIMGGLIVDSCAFPATFRGRYFYADSASHYVATLQPTTDRNGIKAGTRKTLAASNAQPVHLDVGPDGALYWADIGATDGSDGTIERLFPKTPAECPGTPDGGDGAGGTTAGGGAGNGGNSATAGGATAQGGSSPGGGAAGGTGTPGGGTAGTSTNPGGGVPGTDKDAGSPAGGGASDPNGCGCRMASNDSSRLPWLGAALAGVLLARRRRPNRG